MNGSVETTKTETPRCFGKTEYWDENAPECAGGADANFIHPETGRGVRDQCSYFRACGTRVSMQRVIPASNLIRPPIVPPVPSYRPQIPPAPPSAFHEFTKRLEIDRQAATGVSGPSIGTPQPHVTSAPQHAAQWILNYAMPAYLSTHEPQLPGETVWAPLMREVVRSLLKAVGHSVAHFFDSRSLKNKV